MAVQDIEIYAYAKLIPLSYYQEELSKDNAVRFHYMTPKQKNYARVRLLNTMVAMRMDAQEHMERGRKIKLKERCTILQRCCDLLYVLDNEDEPIKVARGRECPLGYLGLYAHLDLMYPKTERQNPEVLVDEVQRFVREIKALDDINKGGTEDTMLRDSIGVIGDWRREHWVAGVSMIQASLQLAWEQNHFRGAYQEQFESGTQALAWPMGFISIFLHLFRFFGVELRESIQQARSNWQPVHSKGVSLPDEGAWARFKADIFGMRKYVLLNDMIWTMVNALTLLWLNGAISHALGFAGSLLTLAFVVLDVILTVLRYLESKRNFEKKWTELDLQYNKVAEQIVELHKQLDTEAQEDERRKLENQILYLQATSVQLKNAQFKLKFDWRYQQYKLWADLGYTSSLVLSFSMMSAFFMVGFGGPLILGVAGSAMWFVMTLVYNGVSVAIDHAKLEANIQQRVKLAEVLIEEFNKPGSKEEKRGLYLQIKELLANNDYEKHQASFMLKKIAIQSFAHALVPVMLFCATVLLPWGVGIVLFGLCALLLFVGKKLMDGWEPVKNEVRFFPSFDKGHAMYKDYNDQYLDLEERQARGEQLTLSTFTDFKKNDISEPDPGIESSIQTS